MMLPEFQIRIEFIVFYESKGQRFLFLFTINIVTVRNRKGSRLFDSKKKDRLFIVNIFYNKAFQCVLKTEYPTLIRLSLQNKSIVYGWNGKMKNAIFKWTICENAKMPVLSFLRSKSTYVKISCTIHSDIQPLPNTKLWTSRTLLTMVAFYLNFPKLCIILLLMIVPLGWT